MIAVAYISRHLSDPDMQVFCVECVTCDIEKHLLMPIGCLTAETILGKVCAACNQTLTQEYLDQILVNALVKVEKMTYSGKAFKVYLKSDSASYLLRNIFAVAIAFDGSNYDLRLLSNQIKYLEFKTQCV